MDAFADLLAGNARHVDALSDDLAAVEDGQSPDVVTVCCSDSRVLQDDMWGNRDPGAVFTVSNIGNRVVQDTPDGETISGDVLYPLHHTDTDVAVVIGHSGCGAVTATHDALTAAAGDDAVTEAPETISDALDEPAGITACVDSLARRLANGVDALPGDLDDADAVNHLVEYNVDRQVDALRESDDVPDDTTVVGVVYDFQRAWGEDRGRIHVVNVDGETDPGVLADQHPDLADHVTRRWTY